MRFNCRPAAITTDSQNTGFLGRLIDSANVRRPRESQGFDPEDLRGGLGTRLMAAQAAGMTPVKFCELGIQVFARDWQQKIAEIAKLGFGPSCLRSLHSFAAKMQALPLRPVCSSQPTRRVVQGQRGVHWLPRCRRSASSAGRTEDRRSDTRRWCPDSTPASARRRR